MKYFPDSTHIVKYQHGDRLSVLILEFIDSDDILTPDLMVEDLHKYCYSFLIQNENTPFDECREIEMIRICPYPPEEMENKLIRVEGDVVIDLRKLDILNGSITQALLGNPKQPDLPRTLKLYDILFRAEISAPEREKLLRDMGEDSISTQTFKNFLELSKILYNLAFYRDPNTEL